MFTTRMTRAATGRGWAYIGAGLGGAVSIAANVAHSYVPPAGAPATCTIAIQRPSDGAAKAQTMNEDTFMSGENSNYGAMFANKITVDCS